MSKFLEELSQSTERMSATCEASALLRNIAEPASAGEGTKAALLRVWRRVNAFAGTAGVRSWTYSRVKCIWYSSPHIRVRADEIALLRACAKRRAKPNEEKAARDDLQELRQRIARLESLLVSTDQDFHRETIAALRNLDGKSG